jgi:DNA anti-recombination protein RmuC
MDKLQQVAKELREISERRAARDAEIDRLLACLPRIEESMRRTSAILTGQVVEVRNGR